MKKITVAFLALFLLVLTVGAAFAVPALERVFTIKQPDGSTFEAFTRGDERAHWTVSDTDKYILAQNDEHWWCFALVENGKLKPSGVHYAKNATPPAGAVKQFSPQPRVKNG